MAKVVDLVSSADGTVTITLPIHTMTGSEACILTPASIKTEASDSSQQDVYGTASILGDGTFQGDHATLQSLLATPLSGAQIIGSPDSIRIITVPNSSELITTSQPDGAGRVWQVVPSLTNPEVATIIAVADPSDFFDGRHEGEFRFQSVEGLEGADVTGTGEGGGAGSVEPVASILMPPPPPPANPLPPNCPNWATRIKNCEKIGDYFRGYVESEVDLDLLLTYHKQQTQSFWGTRQSPSPAKPSTRLMWKSQYVPFDGIPFVNAGSRAVVMECQYGPRRRGVTNKKDTCHDGDYRQTCPARIYVKKVKKFPEFAVDVTLDKKLLKLAMDKAFQDLREHGMECVGQERHYVQLPTEKAHEFHSDSMPVLPPPAKLARMDSDGDDEDRGEEGGGDTRLHPKVIQHIRELVACGESRVYSIRKQLRQFVIKEMFQGTDQVPERHDLTLFPTVNDLKNQIHQAMKDIANGTLQVASSIMGVEIINEDANSSEDQVDLKTLEPAMWTANHASGGAVALPETVTVTLTQNPNEDGHHVISRIETHLSDGTTQVTTQLTPETAQLLSTLHPNMFPAGSLLQLPVTTGEVTTLDGGTLLSGEAVVGSPVAVETSQEALLSGSQQSAESLGEGLPLQIVSTEGSITMPPDGSDDHSGLITVAMVPEDNDMEEELSSEEL